MIKHVSAAHPVPQVAKGVAYPCFCTDEELEAMKKEAEEKKLPPIYRWGLAHACNCVCMMASVWEFVACVRACRVCVQGVRAVRCCAPVVRLPRVVRPCA